jgi:hypothetical protein
MQKCVSLSCRAHRFYEDVGRLEYDVALIGK